MATLRQKKLAKALVENEQATEPLNAGQLLESIGYSAATARGIPGEIIESQGVQSELIKLGFTPDKAKETVAEILIGGENDTVKLKAADMVFKVHGTYAAEKHISVVVNVEETERVKQLADRLRKSSYG